MDILGLHHVTAITGEVQENYDFWHGLLGLRLVKKTVNFDDPSSPHLYYGDARGTPGTLVTFFGQSGAGPGRQGLGAPGEIALSVPPGSLDFWVDRLRVNLLGEFHLTQRFGEKRLTLADPGGIPVSLVEGETVPEHPPECSDIPSKKAVCGMHSVTLDSHHPERTRDFLKDTLGLESVMTDSLRERLEVPAGRMAGRVDLRLETDLDEAERGTGTIHHIAWRTAGPDSQEENREELMSAGLPVSTVKDRSYYRSIYFREPGGLLFEIATDGPGFTVDEPEAELGGTLQLPEELEERRAELEGTLPDPDTD